MNKEQQLNITCPIPKCGKPCTDNYRLSVHIKGAHKDWEKHIPQICEIMDKEDFENFMVANEPDNTVADATIISCADGTGHAKEVGGITLSKYLDSDSPLCREERQFAHLLALTLSTPNRHAHTKQQIEEKLGAQISTVFFEVTIMRDFWAAQKSEYNINLFKYLQQQTFITGEITEWVGDDRTRHPNYWKTPCKWARVLTNAKPDIGIVTTDDMLHFIECKYESGLDCYTVEDKGKTKRIKQTYAQRKILEFLHKHYGIKPGKVIGVQFISDSHKKNAFDAEDAPMEVKVRDLMP
jgi:hypothetical protein